MIFSKYFNFRYKIFKAKDIETIWKFLAALKEPNSNDTSSIRIRNYGEEVSSEDDKVFESLNFLRKDIKEIEIKYRSDDYRSKVSVIIADEKTFSGSYENRVEVESPNEQWVESNSAKLHEIIDFVETTSRITRIWHKIFYLGNLVLCCLMFYYYMNSVIPWIKTLDVAHTLRFMLALLIFAFGAGVAVLTWYLNENLKVVVIDVNGLQSKRDGGIRSIIWSIAAVIVIPILISWYFSKDRQSNIKNQEYNSCISTNVIDNVVNNSATE